MNVIERYQWPTLILLVSVSWLMAHAAPIEPTHPGPKVPQGYDYLWPKLEPGLFSMHGRVFDMDGKPAGGVKVAAFRGEAWQWGYVETRCNQDGRYAFGNLPEGAYAVMAVAPDSFSIRPASLMNVNGFSFDGTPWPKDHTLELDLGLTPIAEMAVVGHVRDAQGKPVSDALVLSVEGWSAYGMGLALQVRTGDEGEFIIPKWNSPHQGETAYLLRPSLIAVKEGAGPGTLLAPTASIPYDIVLENGVRVSGSVRQKETGAPATDIEVLLRGTPADNDLPDIVARTDSNGAFVFDRLCPVQYQLVIYDAAKGYTSTQHPRLNLLEKKDVTDLALEISAGASISGRVIYQETGEPIPGVRVWIPYVRHPVVLRETVSDQAGKYLLDHLPEGTYPIRHVVPDGVVQEVHSTEEGAPPEREVTLTADQQVEGVDIGFERGVAVSGRVTDARGNPIAGARLHAFSVPLGGGGQAFRTRTSEVATAADGAYQLWGVRASDECMYRMTVLAEGYRRVQSAPFNVGAAVTGKDFTLEKGAVISGRVVTTQGQPVATVIVSLKSTLHSPSQKATSAITDDDGYFVIKEGTEPGTYDVELVTLNMGFGPYRTVLAQNSPLDVPGIDDIRGLELTLPD